MYAFGLLIDEMVTTRRAFSADSLQGLLLQKLGDGPEAPSLRSTAMPREWEQTILRCVARDPRDRPASPRAVCASLVGGVGGRRRLLAPTLASRVSRRFRYATAAATAVVGLAVLVPINASPGNAVFIRPFANLTGQADLQYLAIGTASELGRRLTRLPNLRVYTGDVPAAAAPRGHAHPRRPHPAGGRDTARHRRAHRRGHEDAPLVAQHRWPQGPRAPDGRAARGGCRRRADEARWPRAAGADRLDVGALLAPVRAAAPAGARHRQQPGLRGVSPGARALRGAERSRAHGRRSCCCSRRSTRIRTTRWPIR